MQKKDVPLCLCRIKMVFLTVLLCLLVGQGFAAPDSYENTLITLKVKDENLGSVLDKITRLAKVRFFYNHSQLDINQKVTLDVKEQPLKEVLSVLLERQKMKIDFQPNRTVVLQPQPKEIPNTTTKKVAGLIVDAKTREPLIGASVILAEQRSIGVGTDINGKFFIEVPAGTSALLVSYVGYTNETIVLDQKNNLQDLLIRMTPLVEEMEAVVVTGMAPRKVDGFTGSYVSVKGEELKKLSPNNLLKALQFFDPSFRIVENNSRGSDPNTLPEFHLRGDAQIGAVGGGSRMNVNMLLGDYSNRPNMPLFILDGFEANLQRIVDIDPERIESITILKDASATAIYGSRAANGVVVFETKKPKAGALNVSYSTNMGITIPDLRDYNLMNAEEKLQFEWDAGLFNPRNADDMNYYNHYRHEILQGVNTYWLAEPLRTAFTHRHSLAMDGGDESFRYSLNLNLGNTPGVMKESARNTLGMEVGLQYRRKKWNVSNNLSLSSVKGTETPYGSFSEYTKMNPYYRKTDENGNYTKLIEVKPTGLGNERKPITNPLYNTQFPYKNENKNFSITNNFMIECAVLENLRLTGDVSFSKGIGSSDRFKSMNHTDFTLVTDLTKKGSYDKSTANSFSWNSNFQVNYNLNLDRHSLFMNARYSISESKSDGVALSAKGFPNDNMTDFLFAYEMDTRANGNESTTRSLGVIGTLSYMYDMRYAVDFSIRGDMASQFGSNNGMAPFWSVGARWNAFREKWFEDSWVSNLVLSGSYGVTGSQNYQSYQAVESYSFSNLMFPYISSDVLGAELMGFGNKDLGWSKTTDKSVRLEFGFVKNRLNASVNYYHNFTDELLLDYNIAPSSGFTTMVNNAGSVVNKGVDVMLGAILIQNFEKEIQWSVTLNGSHNRNVIKKISNVVKKMNETNLKDRGAPLPIYEEGKSTTQIFAVQSLGIDPVNGKEIFLKRSGEKTYEWDAADKIALGDNEPKMRGSVLTSFNYKDLSISLVGAYQFGGYRYNQTLVDKIENTNIAYNLDRRAAQNRWRKNGDVVPYKGIAFLGQDTPTTSRFVQKFNEFNLSSISVGYRLDSRNFAFLRKCRIASLSVNTTFEDVVRFSTVKQERGLDYPFARSFNLSLSVLFN